MSKVVVICGPSGVGKTSLIKMLLDEESDYLAFTVSHTTRPKRPEETNKIDYNFVTKEEFLTKKFYETCSYSGNLYGTSVEEIEKILSSKKIPILDVNIKSIQQLKTKKELSMLTIFIKPPDKHLEVLRARLSNRSKTTKETSTTIEKRLSAAPAEIEQCAKENMEHVLINDHLDLAYSRLKSIIKPLLEGAKNEIQLCTELACPDFKKSEAGKSEKSETFKNQNASCSEFVSPENVESETTGIETHLLALNID